MQRQKKNKSCFRGWKMQLQFLSPPRSSRYKTSCCQPPCADFWSAPHTLGTWSLNMPPVVCIDRIRQKIPCAFASSQSAWGPPSHPPGSRQKYSHTVSLILPRVWVALNQDWFTQTLLCAHGDRPSLHIYTWFSTNVHCLCNVHSCCFIEMFLQCVAPT